MPRIIGDPGELVTTIRHLARSDAHGIRQQAKEKAEQIRREARERAERKRQEILDRARRRAREVGRMRKVAVNREDKRQYLEAREELLDKVRHRAELDLRVLTEDDGRYAEVLENLALAAVRLLGPGEWILRSDRRGHRLLTADRLEEWAKKAGEALAGAVGFERAAEPLDTWGGLVMADRRGRRRVDATFARRLAMAGTELRSAILEKLVGTNE